MARVVLKVAAATAFFGVVHSALASRTAKRAAARVVGERSRNALYRPFYNAQSFVTLGILALYIRRLPGDTIYHVRPPLSLVLRAGQLSALAYAAVAAHQVGIPRMIGVTGLFDWIRGRPVPAEPEAQGPVRDEEEGGMRTTGPFAWSRHPLNLAPVPVFLLQPRMTTRFAAFTAVSVAYLVLGSVHEEARLRAAYGDDYVRYLRGRTPFYVPHPHRRALTEV